MSLRKQATSGLIWTFAQQFGNQFVTFFISVILARLILPAEFGLIGMILVFYTVGRSLMQSGLTQSLIRSKDVDQEDYSTVFFFNLIASIFIYIIIFFLAPLISQFYTQPILTSLVRLYCITFIIDAFTSVQQARLDKRMDFKTQTLIIIPSSIIGGIAGITMAYLGYGVWSLVWSTIVISFLNAVQYWYYSKWSPSMVFSTKKLRAHFNFGYKLSLAGIIDKVFSNIYIIIIGRYFSASQVGFYTRAETMNQLPVNNITGALAKVTFPLFTLIQDDNIRLKSVYKKLMQMVVFVIAPLLILLAVLAEPTFRFLFSSIWLPAVPYFQILCITGILYPVHMYNINVLKVKGRSDLVLKLEMIKKIFVIVVVAITLQFGILGLLYGQVFLSVLYFLFNAYYTGKLIDYTTWEQIQDIVPLIFLAAGCAGIIWFIDEYYLKTQVDLLRIIMGGGLGFGLYVVLSIIFKIKSFYYLMDVINKR